MAIFSLARSAVLILCGVVLASAQETPALKPVRISFLPPPLDGTISLGIYDPSGKLVRVLHREAELDDFELNHDSVATSWDGKDEAGQALPPGKYHARGYAVGEIGVEGEGFFFNDWITDDDSPHLCRISRLWFQDSKLIILADLPKGEGTDTALWCNRDGKIGGVYRDFLGVGDSAGVKLPLTSALVAWCFGKDDSIWLIDRLAPGTPQTVVKQFSKENKLLRQLTIEADAPQPIGIAAAKEEDRIFLLEQNDAMQRVRALMLVERKEEGGRAVSDWKIEFEKKIIPHRGFGIENAKPLASAGKTLADKMAVKLVPNALKNDRREMLEVFVSYDEKGSFLKTADGLPLQSISDTPHLTRIGLAPSGEKSMDVFQDDDAVVEQYRLTDLDQMMAFDCGEIELK